MDNVVAYYMTRWAYPAKAAFADATMHGSAQDYEEMMAIMAKERRNERIV